MAIDTNSKRFQKQVTIVGVTTLITTMATCLTIVRLRHQYVGKLFWPFFSDMGREAPAYYVFIVGLTTVAITISIMWHLNAKYQRTLFTDVTPRTFLKRVTAATALGMISPIGMPCLAVFGTSKFYVVHTVATGVFFLGQCIAAVINMTVSYHLYSTSKIEHSLVGEDKFINGQKRTQTLRRTFLIQITTFTAFFTAAMISLPIGTALTQDTGRLTIKECLERNLGEKYCTKTVRYNDVDTNLWNYEEDHTFNQMRALLQLTSIIMLLAFMCSFLSHDYENLAKPQETRRRGTLYPILEGSPQITKYHEIATTRMSADSDVVIVYVDRESMA